MLNIILQLQGFNQGELTFLAIITFMVFFVAIKLYSLISTIGAMFFMISLIGHIAFGLEERYLWFSLIVYAVAVTVSMSAFVYYNQNV